MILNKCPWCNETGQVPFTLVITTHPVFLLVFVEVLQHPVVNFTNILRSCEKAAFLYLKFGFILVWHTKIGKKAALKMLVKLTTVTSFHQQLLRQFPCAKNV